MPDFTAAGYAESASTLLATAQTAVDFAEVQAVALTAIALHLTEPELSPVSTGDDSESRQPTGLTRLLAEPTHLPGNVVIEWYVWSADRREYYGRVGADDGSTFSTYRFGESSHAHPSPTAAVAYLIQRQTEETGDAS